MLLLKLLQDQHQVIKLTAKYVCDKKHITHQLEARLGSELPQELL